MICILHIQASFAQPSETSEKTQYISRITFQGNKAIDRKKLSNIANIYPNQKFDPAIIESSLINLLGEYKKIGYMFAKVTWDYIPEQEDKISLNINIQEGEQITIGKISIVSKDSLLKKFPEKRLDIKKLQYFDEYILESDINRILRFCSDKGYPNAIISPQFNIIEGKLNIELNVEINEQVKINEIKLNGLKKTKEKIILRELPIHSGDVFDQSKIDESERILNNLGYFHNVSPISFSQPDGGNFDVIINVTEGATGRFSGLFGYNPTASDNKSRIIGTLDASETNLFGTGRKITILGKRGLINSYLLIYHEPWVLNMPVNIEGHIQITDRADNVIKQDLREREAGLGTTLRIGNLAKGSIAFIYKQIKSSVMIIELPDITLSDSDLANGNKFSIALGMDIDRRDYINNPIKGWLITSGVEVSGGDFRLFKYYLNLSKYYKTFGQQVIALRLYNSQIFGDNIPATELLYLGGSNTLRGYNENQFRGNGIVFVNGEYRFLSGRDSNFFLFLDSGTVYNNGKEINKAKFGYGIGMRLESGNGMVSMDYGLASGDSILKGKIHVSLGAIF